MLQKHKKLHNVLCPTTSFSPYENNFHKEANKKIKFVCEELRAAELSGMGSTRSHLFFFPSSVLPHSPRLLIPGHEEIFFSNILHSIYSRSPFMKGL